MSRPCVEIQQGCEYAGTPECILTRHHEYWPSTIYKTAIERAFRELPANSEYNVPRCSHDEYHEQDPPEKPSEDFMVGFLIGSRVTLSKRVKREIREWRSR